MAWVAVPCRKGEPDSIHVAQSMLARQCGLRRVLRKAKDRDVLSEGLRSTTIAQFIEELDAYIRWYNEGRIKLSLGYLSPIEYRESLGLTT